MRLNTFITIFLFLILAMFGILAITLYRGGLLMDARVEQMGTASSSIQSAEELKSTILTHNRDAFLYLIQGDETLLVRRRAQTEEIEALFEEIQALVATDDEAGIFERVRASVNEYLEFRRELAGTALSPVDQYIQISDYVEGALRLVDTYIAANEIQMAELVEATNRQNGRMQQGGVVFLSLGALTLLVLFLSVIFLISRPLLRLTEAIASYGAGEHQARMKAGGLKEIRSITENFNFMADALVEKRKDLLRFIASIAHDLRTPLHTINMALEVLIMKSGESDQQLAGTMSRQVKLLDSMVSDLLDSSRIEAGHTEVNAKEEDVLPLLREAVELHQAGTELHEIKTALPAGPVICRFDLRLTAQVINNLLSNAIKYSPNGGEVKVSGSLAPGEFTIAVSDQGIGIEQHEKDKIFLPFYRTKITRETIPGIGLGLSASRRIMEAQGGKLYFSSAPGKGSVFTITLPLARPASS